MCACILAMADRDDAQLKQFSSRSKQPKVLRAGPAMQGPSSTNPGLTPLNVFVVFDSEFGGVSDQVDATRFKYTGTSPGLTPYEEMNSRRSRQAFMRSTFTY